MDFAEESQASVVIHIQKDVIADQLKFLSKTRGWIDQYLTRNVDNEFSLPDILSRRYLSDELSSSGRFVQDEEAAMMNLVDADGYISTSANMLDFIVVLSRIVHSEHKALGLYILANRLSSSTATLFVEMSGLKLLRRWLIWAEENENIEELRCIVSICRKLPFHNQKVKESEIGKSIRKLLKLKIVGVDLTLLHEEVKYLIDEWTKQINGLSPKAKSLTPISPPELSINSQNMISSVSKTFQELFGVENSRYSTNSNQSLTTDGAPLEREEIQSDKATPIPFDGVNKTSDNQTHILTTAQLLLQQQKQQQKQHHIKVEDGVEPTTVLTSANISNIQKDNMSIGEIKTEDTIRLDSSSKLSNSTPEIKPIVSDNSEELSSSSNSSNSTTSTSVSNNSLSPSSLPSSSSIPSSLSIPSTPSVSQSTTPSLGLSRPTLVKPMGGLTMNLGGSNGGLSLPSTSRSLTPGLSLRPQSLPSSLSLTPNPIPVTTGNKPMLGLGLGLGLNLSSSNIVSTSLTTSKTSNDTIQTNSKSVDESMTSSSSASSGVSFGSTSSSASSLASTDLEDSENMLSKTKKESTEASLRSCLKRKADNSELPSVSKKAKVAIHWADEEGSNLREVFTFEVEQFRSSLATYKSNKDFIKRERQLERDHHVHKIHDAMQSSIVWKEPCLLQLSIETLDALNAPIESPEKEKQSARLLTVMDVRFFDDSLIAPDPDDLPSATADLDGSLQSISPQIISCPWAIDGETEYDEDEDEEEMDSNVGSSFPHFDASFGYSSSSSITPADVEGGMHSRGLSTYWAYIPESLLFSVSPDFQQMLSQDERLMATLFDVDGNFIEMKFHQLYRQYMSSGPSKPGSYSSSTSNYLSFPKVSALSFGSAAAAMPPSSRGMSSSPPLLPGLHHSGNSFPVPSSHGMHPSSVGPPSVAIQVPNPINVPRVTSLAAASSLSMGPPLSSSLTSLSGPSSLSTSLSKASNAKKVFVTTKANTPCIYHFNSPKGCQYGDRCEFSHVNATLPTGPSSSITHHHLSSSLSLSNSATITSSSASLAPSFLVVPSPLGLMSTASSSYGSSSSSTGSSLAGGGANETAGSRLMGPGKRKGKGPGAR